jgi:hypothetical protein
LRAFHLLQILPEWTREKMAANQITALREFIASWDSPLESTSAPLVPIREGKLGNINLQGTIEGPAPIFTRHHPQFVDSLEAGIKDLVLCLIAKFDCITYSSCAGHASEDGKYVLCGRSVGIVPRATAEYERLREIIATAIRQVDAPAGHVSLQLDESILESDEIDMPCLDVNFRPVANQADQYFGELELVYRRLIKRLNAL